MNYLRLYFLIITFIVFTYEIQSQIVNPKIWMFGYQLSERDTNTLDTGGFKQHGLNVMNFMSIPYNLSRISNGLGLGNCNTIIYDKNDNLILYSNGSKVFNRNHRLIENSDSLCFGSDWGVGNTKSAYYNQYYITRYAEPLVALSVPSKPYIYYLISVYITKDSITNPKIVYSIVDMTYNSGLGKMIQKELPIKLGNFTESIATCRHANAQDWWIIAREYYNKKFTLLRLNGNGINEVVINQQSNWDLLNKNAFKGNFSNRFSWDGKYFASYSYEGLELFDFDRCTGQLSNRREFLIPQDDTSSCSYVCFSPDNKLIYALLGHKIYQIEISTQIRRKIADWDYREDTVDGGTASFYTSFGIPQLAPDGKIYISTSEGTRYLHYIDKPNEIGLACDFRQRSIKLQNWNIGLPMFPNYELGADTSCHESSLDELERYKIDIYPNPASARIRIEGVSHETVIYNTLGQQVLVSKDKDIDISHLPVGVYHVLLSDRNGTVLKREKLIIQR